MSIRILFVEASMGGVLGGSLTGILELIRHLDPRFASALVLYEPKEGLDAALRGCSVPTHVLPGLSKPHGARRRTALGRAIARVTHTAQVVVPRVRALGRMLAVTRPSLVYLANGLPANVDGVIAAARARLPMITHQKGFRRIGPLDRAVSRWVDVCVGMTDEITSYYRARRLRARRFVTVFDGIDVHAWHAGGGPAVRAEFGIPAAAPLVGIVGHIQDWKGQLLVAEAVALARRRRPDVYCLVVGGVHHDGAAYAARLRDRADAPDLAGHLLLAGARSDVAACFDAVDVALHASVRPEPFGRVLLEAMALGRPIVAPREGGPLAIVLDGETGLLVPPRDPQALADAIVTLIDDEARRRRMGQAARARVEAVFDIRQHARTIEALFDEVLGAVPGQPARFRNR